MLGPLVSSSGLRVCAEWAGVSKLCCQARHGQPGATPGSPDARRAETRAGVVAAAGVLGAASLGRGVAGLFGALTRRWAPLERTADKSAPGGAAPAGAGDALRGADVGAAAPAAAGGAPGDSPGVAAAFADGGAVAGSAAPDAEQPHGQAGGAPEALLPGAAGPSGDAGGSGTGPDATSPGTGAEAPGALRPGGGGAGSG